MKRIEEPVVVEARKGWPVLLRRSGKMYRVLQQLDFWVVQGRWWMQEEKRVYFRVRTDRGVLELYNSRGEWVLSKVFD